ncbi:histidine phosphatase family protein [Schaalia sp. Marseille-Q2122]|uniref:histidine phosphatase family protein n=1 Tax=Schaalia sp. Marseille-Q2122 TaxID=2736604 RepID=UPI00158EC605|nr:histidine phosphatase family protein [Schaalia sp. Marseille-Q2122]
MRLVLVRHGQTSSNATGALDTGRPGAPLNGCGQEQAHSLARRWESEVAAPPSAIAVSPLTRTRQTAAPLCERYGITPMVRPGIREVRSGDLEMNASLSDIGRYMGTLAPWAGGDWDVRMPGGESGREILGRALPVVQEVLLHAFDVAGEHGVGVIVAHGALNRVIAATLAPEITVPLVMKYRLENTHTAVLDLPSSSALESLDAMLGGFEAQTWNERPVGEWDVSDGVVMSLNNG